MNEIVNKPLLAGDKFMSEMYLKHSGPFNINKDRVQKFKETGDSKGIYKNELNKACFQHDMAYRDFKYLSKRKASDRVLRNKAFNIAKYPKYDGYQRGITPIFDKKTLLLFQIKKTSGTGANNKIKQNQQLAEELHKPIIRKLKKRKVYLSFKDNIWVADLADMQLIGKFNKGLDFYYVLLIFLANIHELFL